MRYANENALVMKLLKDTLLAIVIWIELVSVVVNQETIEGLLCLLLIIFTEYEKKY